MTGGNQQVNQVMGEGLSLLLDDPALLWHTNQQSTRNKKLDSQSRLYLVWLVKCIHISPSSK